MWGKVFITMGILLGGMFIAAPPVASQEDIATQSSASLTINAWKALNNEDFESAITYADACITRFGAAPSACRPSSMTIPPVPTM